MKNKVNRNGDAKKITKNCEMRRKSSEVKKKNIFDH